jgi:hypothetical protein
MEVANTCRKIGEKHSQQSSAKEGLYHLGDDGWNQVVCISGGVYVTSPTALRRAFKPVVWVRLLADTACHPRANRICITPIAISC